MQLKTLRNNNTLKIYSQSTADRPENIMQRAAGFDITHNISGRIPYTRLRTTHIAFLRKEIVAQGHPIEPKDKIRALGKKLCEIEVAIQKEMVRETTGNEMPDKSMLNKVSYLPRCRPSNDYELF